MAGLPRPPVGVQRALEVPRLAQHVHVQGIEACAARRQGLAQHLRDRLQQFAGLRGAEGACGLRVVQPRTPQSLVGVDIAHPGDYRLVQQHLLDAAGGAQELAAHRRGVEELIQRVAGNVLDCLGDQKTLRYFALPHFIGRYFIRCNRRGDIRHERAEEHAAEDALIHEEQALPGACPVDACPVDAYRAAGSSRSAGSSRRS